MIDAIQRNTISTTRLSRWSCAASPFGVLGASARVLPTEPRLRRVAQDHN